MSISQCLPRRGASLLVPGHLEYKGPGSDANAISEELSFKCLIWERVTFKKKKFFSAVAKGHSGVGWGHHLLPLEKGTRGFLVALPFQLDRTWPQV